MVAKVLFWALATCLVFIWSDLAHGAQDAAAMGSMRGSGVVGRRLASVSCFGQPGDEECGKKGYCDVAELVCKPKAAYGSPCYFDVECESGLCSAVQTCFGEGCDRGHPGVCLCSPDVGCSPKESICVHGQCVDTFDCAKGTGACTDNASFSCSSEDDLIAIAPFDVKAKKNGLCTPFCTMDDHCLHPTLCMEETGRCAGCGSSRDCKFGSCLDDGTCWTCDESVNLCPPSHFCLNGQCHLDCSQDATVCNTKDGDYCNDLGGGMFGCGISCTENSQCLNGAPTCWAKSKRCGGCQRNSDCQGGLSCLADTTCALCDDVSNRCKDGDICVDGTCVRYCDKNPSVCDEKSGAYCTEIDGGDMICMENCSSDDQCPAGAPKCWMASKRCGGCTKNADCGVGLTCLADSTCWICDQLTNLCPAGTVCANGMCLLDCSHDPEVCDGESGAYCREGYCRDECASNDECLDGAPTCWASSKRCGGCSLNSHCQGGLSCLADSSCALCDTVSRLCPTGAQCINGVCTFLQCAAPSLVPEGVCVGSVSNVEFLVDMLSEFAGNAIMSSALGLIEQVIQSELPFQVQLCFGGFSGGEVREMDNVCSSMLVNQAMGYNLVSVKFPQFLFPSCVTTPDPTKEIELCVAVGKCPQRTFIVAFNGPAIQCIPEPVIKALGEVVEDFSLGVSLTSDLVLPIEVWNGAKIVTVFMNANLGLRTTVALETDKFLKNPAMAGLVSLSLSGYQGLQISSDAAELGEDILNMLGSPSRANFDDLIEELDFGMQTTLTCSIGIEELSHGLVGDIEFDLATSGLLATTSGIPNSEISQGGIYILTRASMSVMKDVLLDLLLLVLDLLSKVFGQDFEAKFRDAIQQSKPAASASGQYFAIAVKREHIKLEIKLPIPVGILGMFGFDGNSVTFTCTFFYGGRDPDCDIDLNGKLGEIISNTVDWVSDLFDKDLVCDKNHKIILHEGNECTQQLTGSIGVPSLGTSNIVSSFLGCIENDETRSITLTGPIIANTVIEVFNRKSGDPYGNDHCSESYAHILITRTIRFGETVCITSLETGCNPKDLSCFYRITRGIDDGFAQLDGKVSRFEVHAPHSDGSPRIKPRCQTPRQICNLNDPVRLFEGMGCSGKYAGSLALNNQQRSKLDCFPNDRARSVQFRGPIDAGWSFWAADNDRWQNSDGTCPDDVYVVLLKQALLPGEIHCINLEDVQSTSKFEKVFHRHQGLLANGILGSVTVAGMYNSYNSLAITDYCRLPNICKNSHKIRMFKDYGCNGDHAGSLALDNALIKTSESACIPNDDAKSVEFIGPIETGWEFFATDHGSTSRNSDGTCPDDVFIVHFRNSLGAGVRRCVDIGSASRIENEMRIAYFPDSGLFANGIAGKVSMAGMLGRHPESHATTFCRHPDICSWDHQVIMYSEDNCAGDYSGTVGFGSTVKSSESSCFDNDKARSVKFVGPLSRGTQFWLADHGSSWRNSDGTCPDDVQVFHFQQDLPAGVTKCFNLEYSGTSSGIRGIYHRNNGLKGKVSMVQLTTGTEAYAYDYCRHPDLCKNSHPVRMFSEDNCQGSFAGSLGLDRTTVRASSASCFDNDKARSVHFTGPIPAGWQFWAADHGSDWGSSGSCPDDVYIVHFYDSLADGHTRCVTFETTGTQSPMKKFFHRKSGIFSNGILGKVSMAGMFTGSESTASGWC